MASSTRLSLVVAQEDLGEKETWLRRERGGRLVPRCDEQEDERDPARPGVANLSLLAAGGSSVPFRKTQLRSERSPQDLVQFSSA